jgi:hypothetical protein
MKLLRHWGVRDRVVEGDVGVEDDGAKIWHQDVPSAEIHWR